MVSLDETGVQVVDADSVRGPLGGEAAREVRDGTLGAVVEDLGDGRVDDRVRHGRDDDDRTLLLALDPEVGGGLGRVEDAEDVDVEDLLEVVGGELERGLDDRDARVGGDGVDLAEVLLDLGKGRLDLVRVSDVALVRLDRLVVLLGEVGSDFLGILWVSSLLIRSFFSRTLSLSTNLGRVVDHG